MYDETQQMCCDYEKWSDGSYNCLLYAGGNTKQKDASIFKNEMFSNIVFAHQIVEGQDE